MALSQKHVGKMLVPWFNSKEWKHVNNLLFASNSTDIEKLKALEILEMWKTRTPKLPSGVEGTKIILEALLQKKDSVSEDKLRILYGASIMRFLNLCGATADKQGTFYKTAKQNNLPDWLIDLRHDIAHDQIIPSMFMLQMGLEFCLNWLKTQYWEKQNATIKDFIIDINQETDIKTILELYFQINLAHDAGNLKNIQDLAAIDPLISDKIHAVTDIDDETDIKDLLNILLNFIRDRECFCPEIICENLVTATVQTQCNELPKKYLVMWKDLITLLYLENKLLPVIKKLVNISNNIELTEQTRKIASLWLAELCKSLLLAKNISNEYKSLSQNQKLNKETASTILKILVQKGNPELKDCLELDFNCCENIIRDLSSLRLNVLQNPHQFTLIFVKFFLQVIGCSDEYINNTKNIIKNYLYPQNNILGAYNKLHTLEEYKKTIPNNTNSPIPMETEENSVPNIVQTEATPSNVSQRRWRIIEDTSIFTGCPLGVLAYQDKVTNPLLHVDPL